MHRYFLHNEQLEEASARTLSAGQAGLLAGWGVFSTLHVSDGVLFAFERHFERMRRDASKLRVPFSVDSEALRGALLRLVQGNNAWNASLRVSIIRNQGGFQAAPDNLPAADVVAFTRDITPWPSEVRLMMKHAGRYAQGEFSGTKILSWAHNLVWYEDAHARGYDEALLLNERGEASECTSANIFAVFGQTACTPPLSSGCLPGVTRALLLSDVKVPDIRVCEKPLTPTDLEQADQVFITSTTRDVLPVSSIEGLKIQNRGTVASALREALKRYRAQYVEAHAAAALTSSSKG